jgi:hypothetical protein
MQSLISFVLLSRTNHLPFRQLLPNHIPVTLNNSPQYLQKLQLILFLLSECLSIQLNKPKKESPEHPFRLICLGFDIEQGDDRIKHQSSRHILIPKVDKLENSPHLDDGVVLGFEDYVVQFGPVLVDVEAPIDILVFDHEQFEALQIDDHADHQPVDLGVLYCHLFGVAGLVLYAAVEFCLLQEAH